MLLDSRSGPSMTSLQDVVHNLPRVRSSHSSTISSTTKFMDAVINWSPSSRSRISPCDGGSEAAAVSSRDEKHSLTCAISKVQAVKCRTIKGTRTSGSGCKRLPPSSILTFLDDLLYETAQEGVEKLNCRSPSSTHFDWWLAYEGWFSKSWFPPPDLGAFGTVFHDAIIRNNSFEDHCIYDEKAHQISVVRAEVAEYLELDLLIPSCCNLCKVYGIMLHLKLCLITSQSSNPSLSYAIDADICISEAVNSIIPLLQENRPEKSIDEICHIWACVLLNIRHCGKTMIVSRGLEFRSVDYMAKVLVRICPSLRSLSHKSHGRCASFKYLARFKSFRRCSVGLGSYYFFSWLLCWW